MKRNYHCYVDDNIWVFRDLAAKRPASLFDNEYLKIYKDLHDKYNMKVQLNIFYKTDLYYGDDDFDLSRMPDCYKQEWEENSNWLRLAFHAKQEFPDYPYLNASYETVKKHFQQLEKEVIRFAGEATFTYDTNTHWLPMSYEGCRALVDCGVKRLGVSNGILLEDEPYLAKLPYGHSGRLLQNRKKESGIFKRNTADESIAISLKGYNHIDNETNEKTYHKNLFHKDEATGLNFKRFCTTGALNLYKKDEVEPLIMKNIGHEYIGIATHEQYFYSDYYVYQPDFGEKMEIAVKILHENGYESVFLDEI